MLHAHILDRIASNLADIGALALDDYLGAEPRLQPHGAAPASEPSELSAVTRLHHACQRALRSTDALKFEFIEQAGSRNKQCILTITKPDGVQRSYATQPVFVKKSEAKSEVAKIAIDMGALDFLAGGDGATKPATSAEPSSADLAAPSDAMSPHSETAPETCTDDIEQCCLEWHAGRVTPSWVPFFDTKSAHKQGCALRIQLSPHVARVYMSDPTFDSYSDAKGACAKAAVLEGVLNFIKHGNGQTRPPSPGPSFPSTSSPSLPTVATTPWTLQGFYDTLPRPFAESFNTNDAFEINAPGWLNTMVQNARGGKLILSFFFTSDGPPGLHGCLLRLDRPGEYKASLVDARFPKRSDAKAAVCLQAMSEGIGNYIRSIASIVDTRVTPAMRSFSSGLVYPALMSELSKIDTELYPHFEYDKERDAFGATLIVRLSTSPTPNQVGRYTVPREYRNKADAKTAVICHAAEQGVVEFVHFRGGTPPAGYQTPYMLCTYNPDTSRKRKQPVSTEDAEPDQPAKKKRKKKKGKRRAEAPSPDDESSSIAPAGQCPSIHPSGDQTHGISGPGDMGPSPSFPVDSSYDPSQSGVGGGGGSGVAHPAMYGHGASYPAVLDPRFAGASGLGGGGYGVYPPSGMYSGGPHPQSQLQLPCAVDVPLSESGLSRAWPGTSARAVRRPTEDAELEPGEVVSSAESEFSESSSRNEDGEVIAQERDTDANEIPMAGMDVDMESGDKGKDEASHASMSTTGADKTKTGGESVAWGNKDKGKGKEKETSPTNTSTTVSHDGPRSTPTGTVSATSHVKKLIGYCATHQCGTPSFHETQREGRFQVWIVIGQERFDLPTTYGSAEEGRQRVAKQVLARLSKGCTGAGAGERAR